MYCNSVSYTRLHAQSPEGPRLRRIELFVDDEQSSENAREAAQLEEPAGKEPSGRMSGESNHAGMEVRRFW